MTGNINLRCPFMNIKKGNEVMLPIHCAAMGGSLKVLSWLVDVHYCPLKMINTGNKTKKMNEELIATSNGRTVMDISMQNQKVDILRYLVQQKNIPVRGKKKNQSSLVALEAVLKAFPKAPSGEYVKETPLHRKSPSCKSHRRRTNGRKENNASLYNISKSDEETSVGYLDEKYGYSSLSDDADDEQSIATTVDDPCVICYEKTIDCVLTPCGHQICCLECSKELSKCPICASSCQAIRIYRP